MAFLAACITGGLKITGRMYPENWAKLSAAIIFVDST